MLAELLHQAFRSLGDNRLRTYLSILGITIGIGSVMIVSTISKGGNHIVFSELETFGLESVWVNRDRNSNDALKQALPGSGIQIDDIRVLQQRRSDMAIAQFSPLVWMDRNNHIARRGEKQFRGDVIGIGPAYLSIGNDAIQTGRHFVDADIEKQRSVALLAPDVVEALYRTGEPVVGSTLRVGSKRFLVVGILAEKNRDFLASIGSVGGRNANNRILIPYTSVQAMKGDRDVSMLHLEVTEMKYADYAGQRLTQFLQQRHPGYDYEYETMEGHIKTTNTILGGVATVGIVAASISLLVGGMGIMNMMGTSVLERTREIGIRKALGARESDILLQFLLEASIISLIGGVLGLSIGAGLSVLLAHVTGFPVLPSYLTIAAAFVVSIVIGIVSGYLPARRAARLHPVTALRTD